MQQTIDLILYPKHTEHFNLVSMIASTIEAITDRIKVIIL